MVTDSYFRVSGSKLSKHIWPQYYELYLWKRVLYLLLSRLMSVTSYLIIAYILFVGVLCHQIHHPDESILCLDSSSFYDIPNCMLTLSPKNAIFYHHDLPFRHNYGTHLIYTYHIHQSIVFLATMHAKVSECLFTVLQVLQVCLSDVDDHRVVVGIVLTSLPIRTTI